MEEWREQFKQKQDKFMQKKLWFYLILGFMTMSISLLFLGFIGAMFQLWNVQISTMTGIISMITTIFSGILLKYQHTLQKNND